jgi:hypothetical protein
MSDLLEQLELADPRSKETQWVERMARAILESPRYKGAVVCWSQKMPDYLHAELFKQADRHGLTLTDMNNYILEQSLNILKHSAPMKGKIIKHVDRRTRAKRRKAGKGEEA